MNEHAWWEGILDILRELALPVGREIGPFDVYRFYAGDPSDSFAESLFVVIIDSESQVGIELFFDVIGRELVTVEFKCNALLTSMEERLQYGKAEHPSIEYETIQDQTLEQAVGVIWDWSKNVSEFPWSYEDLTEDLSIALNRCMPFTRA